MPDLQFKIEGAEAVAYAATPMLALKLRVTNAPENEPIHSLSLNCQIQIEPTRRRYAPDEQEKLLDLFGEPERWSRTVRSLLWMNTTVAVPAFTGSTVVDLQLPCSFDFNIATTKYFHALESGEIPLCVLFSGTVFYSGEGGALQIAQVPWNQEASYRFPAAVWKQMMDIYYPNSAWLRIERDCFDRLYQYKVRHGIPSWEQMLDRLISSKEEDEVPV
jgi:Family of unknown function (DUF6084)